MDSVLEAISNMFKWYNTRGISDQTMHMWMVEDHGYSIYSS